MLTMERKQGNGIKFVECDDYNSAYIDQSHNMRNTIITSPMKWCIFSGTNKYCSDVLNGTCVPNHNYDSPGRICIEFDRDNINNTYTYNDTNITWINRIHIVPDRSHNSINILVSTEPGNKYQFGFSISAKFKYVLTETRDHLVNFDPKWEVYATTTMSSELCPLNVVSVSQSAKKRGIPNYRDEIITLDNHDRKHRGKAVDKSYQWSVGYYGATWDTTSPESMVVKFARDDTFGNESIHGMCSSPLGWVSKICVSFDHKSDSINFKVYLAKLNPSDNDREYIDYPPIDIIIYRPAHIRDHKKNLIALIRHNSITWK